MKFKKKQNERRTFVRISEFEVCWSPENQLTDSDQTLFDCNQRQMFPGGTQLDSEVNR